jgi:hypothetical protein
MKTKFAGIAFGAAIMVAAVIIVVVAIGNKPKPYRPCGDVFSRAETDWEKTCEISR